MKRMRITKRALSVLTVMALILSILPAGIVSHAVTSNNWHWPTASGEKEPTGGWPKYSTGYDHQGQDFKGNIGDPIYSTCDGEVFAVSSYGDYGNYVRIKAVVNGQTVYIMYAHMSSQAATVGAKVSAGQLIGYVGNTGFTTGPHLHYEINLITGLASSVSQTLNPNLYLPGTSYTFESNKVPIVPEGKTPKEYKSFTYDGHTYKVYASMMSWTEAKSWCESKGGYLCTITSNAERTAVSQIADDYTNPLLYLGGFYDSGTWKWVTGESFSYQPWGTGQPDLLETEHYLCTWNALCQFNNVIEHETNYLAGFIFESSQEQPSVTEQAAKPCVVVNTYAINEGWAETQTNGAIVGTAPSDTISANRIEAVKLSLQNCSGTIRYTARMIDGGLITTEQNGAVAGVTDHSDAIEGIRISLSGDAASIYDIYYRTFVFCKGWVPWTRNGNDSGSTGGRRPILALQVTLVPKVTYSAHVHNIGWMSTVGNQETVGTTGQSASLQALKIQLSSNAYGNILYQSHLSSCGWGKYVYNGTSSGSTSLSLPMEAIQIKLNGTAALQFDVLYRAHIAGDGWLGWVKSGETAGTTGQSKQMEAIQIRVVPKGAPIADSTSFPTCTEIKPTIFFNPNGGTCATSSKAVTFGGIFGGLPTPTNQNKMFDGWYTEKTGGKLIYETRMVRTDQNMTVYAHWSDPKQMTVSFDPTGGVCSTQNKTVTYDSAYGELPTPSYDGCTFLGWFSEADGEQKITADTIVSQTTDHTLYAHWQAITVTDISIHTLPTKTSYAVGDMLDTTGLSLMVSKSDESSETVTTGFECSPTELTVAGTQTIAVTYSGKTATFTVTVKAARMPGDVNDDDRVNLKDVVILRRFLSTGWDVTIDAVNADVNNDLTIDLKDIVLLCRYLSGGWDITLQHSSLASSTFNLLFDACGGSVNVSSMSIACNEAFGELPIPTKPYCTFNGWFSAADGGDQITAETVMRYTDDLTVYAHWTINPPSE